MEKSTLKLKNVEFDGIDRSDYPDFCDAFIVYAEHADGTPLTEQELENIPSETVHSLLWDYLH